MIPDNPPIDTSTALNALPDGTRVRFRIRPEHAPSWATAHQRDWEYFCWIKIDGDWVSEELLAHSTKSVPKLFEAEPAGPEHWINEYEWKVG